MMKRPVSAANSNSHNKPKVFVYSLLTCESEVFPSCRTRSGIQEPYHAESILDSGFRRNDDNRAGVKWFQMVTRTLDCTIINECTQISSLPVRFAVQDFSANWLEM